jgi:uncharacterized protein (DUF427 family)
MDGTSGNPPRGWDLNPDYEIEFDVIPARVTVVLGGASLADSTSARVMYELGHAPVYYLPREDVGMSRLEPTEHSTYCPYKGYATYWSARVGDRVAENAVWTYPEPDPALPQLKDFLGFYWGRMDAWREDGEQVSGPREIPGRVDTEKQLKRLFPGLAAEWHPTRNPGIKPYEFPAYSGTVVWWRDASGREWRESIRDRVLAVTPLRADGDANPYG